VVRWDRPGCGLSDPSPDPPSLEEDLEVLEAVADQLGLDCFDLLGISMGAPTSIAFATRHPDRVGRLVVYGGFEALLAVSVLECQELRSSGSAGLQHGLVAHILAVRQGLGCPDGVSVLWATGGAGPRPFRSTRRTMPGRRNVWGGSTRPATRMKAVARLASWAAAAWSRVR
jgi:pimeloyl-ACP methyl ester carboxylesterase